MDTNPLQSPLAGAPQQPSSPVPPPKPPGSDASAVFPKVDVRTMVSDTKSIQEGGGSAPKPYTPGVSSAASSSSTPGVPSYVPSATPVPPPIRPIVIPSPASPVMPPPVAPTVPGAPSQPIPPTGSATKAPKIGGSKKGIFVLVLTVMLVVGIGSAVYFFILPLFKGGVTPPVTDQPLAIEQPQPIQTEQPPIVAAPLPEAETPPSAEPATAEPAPAAVASPQVAHVSLLKTPADLKNDVDLTRLDTAAIREGVGFTKADVASLKEVVLKDSSGSLALSGVGRAIAPSFFTDEVLQLFEDDFTLVVYTDSNGSWPVYLLKTKSGVDAAEVDTKIKSVETIPTQELANFFLADPGTKSAWKSGSVGGLVTRYSTFSQLGAGFNYGRKDTVVLLGTSYAAFKEAVNRFSE